MDVKTFNMQSPRAKPSSRDCPTGLRGLMSYLFFAAVFISFSLSAAYSLYSFAGAARTRGGRTPSVEGAAAERGGAAKFTDGLDEKSASYKEYAEGGALLFALDHAAGRSPFDRLKAEEETPPEEAPAPPEIAVKALIVMETSSAAGLAIEGEPDLAVVQKGYVFGGGKGVITSIDPRGVSWTWSNKKYRTEL